MKNIKVVKVALPVVLVAFAFSVVARQKLNQHILASADGGSLPETKVLAAKLFAPGITPPSAKHRARLAQIPRTAK